MIILNIYIMLVLSSNLTVGMAGLLTMCQAAFYGIGAYIGTFFLIQFDMPFVSIAVIVMAATGLFSLPVSLASVKLKGDYFVMATMCFQLIVFTILYNWTSVTNGSYGISGIPGIKLFGFFQLTGVYAYLALSSVLMLISVILFSSLKKSPYGRVLNAIRADEIVVESLGRNVSMSKSWAFFISASMAGLAGLIYASYIGYIDPTSFTLDESIFIISALFIGGLGNVRGPVLGALFVVLLPEMLRLIGLSDAVAANLRQIIYGLSLILVMCFRPQGLLGKTALK